MLAALAGACPEESVAPVPTPGGGAGGAPSPATGGAPLGGSPGCAATEEIPCNGVDDDCDAATPDEPDLDLDLATWCWGYDCDDDDPSVYPGARDFCGDTVDQDCADGDQPCDVCGDGAVTGDEGCDDGNQLSGDGCRGDCSAVEICGDDLAQLPLGEECDGLADAACPGSCVACVCTNPAGPWRFEDAAFDAGLTAVHAWNPGMQTLGNYQLMSLSGGVAASDYDDDGDVDLFVVGCTEGQSALYRNAGDGTFEDVTAAAGLPAPVGCDAGPIFADFDGDGRDDLFVGGVADQPARLFVQADPGAFVDATFASGLDVLVGNVMGGALADIDTDGDLDLALGRWGTPEADAEHLLRNDSGVFSPATVDHGLASIDNVSFTPNFFDLDEDGWLDLVFASDFHTSRVFLGSQQGLFIDVTTPGIDDDNGMGSAIGDYDGDGDLDWFVSSIWDPDGVPEGLWGTSGNRLYENVGGGALVDVSEQAGVRRGFWGWGACFADFDNDGDLDLFHTNGFTFSLADEFHDDPSVLFLSNGDGTFSERAADLGLVDAGQGRGIVCFDYDRDGDVDILVQDNGGPMRLYRNNGALAGHHLTVALSAPPPNSRGIGARVEVTSAGVTRVGVLRAGSNYASQDPAELHFGLGDATTVEAIVVRRPGGQVSTFGPLGADQRVVLSLP